MGYFHKKITKNYRSLLNTSIDNCRGSCWCPCRRVYLDSKSDKYRIKIIIMNDSRTFYKVNVIPSIAKVNCKTMWICAFLFCPRIDEMHSWHREKCVHWNIMKEYYHCGKKHPYYCKNLEWYLRPNELYNE